MSTFCKNCQCKQQCLSCQNKDKMFDSTLNDFMQHKPLFTEFNNNKLKIQIEQLLSQFLQEKIKFFNNGNKKITQWIELNTLTQEFLIFIENKINPQHAAFVTAQNVQTFLKNNYPKHFVKLPKSSFPVLINAMFIN